jgi:hypothetical protein
MARIKEDVVTLTRDGIWPWRIPADPGEEWPFGAEAHTRFMNSAGAVIADIDADEVTPTAIKFLAQPGDVNAIPAGAQFETFVETDDGPLKIRYGIVQRPEATFFNRPGASLQQAQLFRDSLQRTGLGWRWEPVYGSTKLWDNSGQSLPFGMGPNVGLFNNQKSALRWYQQAGGDSVESSFTIVMPTVIGENNGYTTAVICADQNFTSGLAVTVNSYDHLLGLARVTSPTSVVALGAPVADTQHNDDNYRVRYNDLTDTLTVYKGTSLSPLITWVDAAHIVPHGNGFRHFGFMFSPTFLETGPQVSGWEGKDAA